MSDAQSQPNRGPLPSGASPALPDAAGPAAGPASLRAATAPFYQRDEERLAPWREAAVAEGAAIGVHWREVGIGWCDDLARRLIEAQAENVRLAQRLGSAERVAHEALDERERIEADLEATKQALAQARGKVTRLEKRVAELERRDAGNGPPGDNNGGE